MKRVQSSEFIRAYTKRQTGWDSPISHSQRAAKLMKRDTHMRDGIGVALRCGCGGQVRGAEAREGQFRHESDIMFHMPWES